MSNSTPDRSTPETSLDQAPPPYQSGLVEREGHRLTFANGKLRLELDLRTEFPFFNYLSYWDETRGEYKRFCNIGVEAMPMPIVLPNESDEGEPAPAFNVWLSGHEYTAKDLAPAEGLPEDQARLQIAYPPPMVVAGEFSTMSGGQNLDDFPNWGTHYWERAEAMPFSIQALWSMRPGEHWIDLMVRPALGDLMAIMPMLHHGACGHDDLPKFFFGGGQFFAAQAPDGSWPSHLELFDGVRADRAQVDFAGNQAFVFFGDQPSSAAFVFALDRPHPEGFMFAGQNDSPVSAESESPHYRAAASKRDGGLPDKIHMQGFTEQTLFFEVGQNLPRLRLAVYPNTPLPYGDAGAVNEFLASRPEIAEWIATSPRDAALAAQAWPKGYLQQGA